MGSFLVKAWFPTALLVLFLAAIPGVLLVILTMAGEDASVNEWLQNNWNVSYHLTLPPWLVLPMLLVPPLILLLYFLKLKRKPLQVSSTLLWKKSIEDLHVNALFQWLRQNLLLLLQILAALFLIYSLLGVRFHGRVGTGKHYILLIDNSASMSAQDVAPSRLEWAKQEALKEIDAASDNDVGMVIAFNSKATTVQGYTTNRAKLRDAVRSIEPTQRVTRIDEALTLIDSLANPVRSTEDQAVRPEDEKPGEERAYVPPQGIATTVHLYSDGRFAKLSESTILGLSSRQLGNTALLGNIQMRYHQAGVIEGRGQANNLAIVGINALRLGGRGADPKKPEPERFQVLVRLLNFRKTPSQVRVKLDVYEAGKLVVPAHKDVKLAGRVMISALPESGEDDKDEPGVIREQYTPAGWEPTDGAVLFDLPALEVSKNVTMHAYLENPRDAFALDNEAWLVIGNVRKAKVLIVGPANPILDAFFDQEATRRLATWQRIPAKDLETDVYRNLVRQGDVDLVIFDRCTPASEADLPQANAFFIDQVPPPWRRGTRTLKNPYLILSKRDHPILRYIHSLWDMGVSEAFSFDVVRNLDDKTRALAQLPEGDTNRRILPTPTRLIEASGGSPVLFTLPRGPFLDLTLAFPLVTSGGDLTTNWPLQPSFPLFLRNLLYILGNVDDSVRSASGSPGEPLILRPEAGVRELTVTTPKGASVKLNRGNRSEFTFADTESLGVYQVERDDAGKAAFAVNLLDANESLIEPRSEIRFGGEAVVTGAPETVQPRDVWKWILLVALVLLVVEWVLYNRRVAV